MQTKQKILSLFFLLATATSCYIKGEIMHNPTEQPTSDINRENLGMTLLIKSEKEIYKQSEPIIIDLELINNNLDKSMWVNTRFAINKDYMPQNMRDVEFIILDPQGNQLGLNGGYIETAPLLDSYFILLKPGERATGTFPGINYFYDMSTIGAYTITLEYSNVSDKEGSTATWKGTLTSNTISVKVVP
jgi:hypothetical protein